MSDILKDPIGTVTGAILGTTPGEAAAPISQFRPTGFSAGGLTGQDVGGTFEISRTPGLESELGGLQSALSARAGEFANLRKGLNRDIAPLIGSLRETGVQAIRGQRRRAIGDLRENLARRRVAGSSFAQDALSRAEAEFAKEEAEFGSQAGIQELQLRDQLLAREMELVGAETEANVQSFQASLNQLNLESGLAAQISTGLSQIAAANAQAIAQINADFAAARANIVGTAIGAGATAGGGGGASSGAVA